MRPCSPWETSLHCNDVSHWLGAYLDWSLLSSIGHVDQHCVLTYKEECSTYFLVITHQTQASDDIDGLMQERLKYVFLTPSHPYKECHLWITTPPHLTQPLIISFNAMKSIWQCLKLFLFYQWSMHWAYNITLYCTATYREYHIGTVKFVIHNHFHHFQYLHRLLKSSLRCPVTQRCSLDMSLILSCSSMPCSDYLKMVGMDKYSTLKM